MLFLLWKHYAYGHSEKAKEACHLFPAQSHWQMRWQHCIDIGSLAVYIGVAVDEPLFSLAFITVKESFVILTILFYLASNANKR